jgi:hypothetical protein
LQIIDANHSERSRISGPKKRTGSTRRQHVRSPATAPLLPCISVKLNQINNIILSNLASISIRTTNRYKGVKLASVADHKKVADAIIAGKPLAAGKAMRSLIQEALNLICKHEDKLAAYDTKESVRRRSTP